MIPEITRAAQIMRRILEEIRFSNIIADIGAFGYFPEGCCEYATVYLGRYLIRENICSIENLRVPEKNITNSEGKTHAWLNVNGNLNVDITADQFGKEQSPVIVSANSSFHNDFQPMKWEPFEDTDHFVFEQLAESLPYIKIIWAEIRDSLPSLTKSQSNPN